MRSLDEKTLLPRAAKKDEVDFSIRPLGMSGRNAPQKKASTHGHVFNPRRSDERTSRMASMIYCLTDWPPIIAAAAPRRLRRSQRKHTWFTMTKKHLYPMWLVTAAKSGGLLVAAALAGCLSDGSELITAEAGSSNTKMLVVVPGANPNSPGQPSYLWNIGTIAALDVVRITNPSSPVWGISVDGGADLVPRPVTHGTFPVTGVSIASNEPVLP